MSLGRAWAVRDLGERTKAAREVRKAVRPGQAPDDDVLRNPGAPALPGRLARKTGHAVARVLGAGAHTVTASVTHAAHRVAKLTAVTHRATSRPVAGTTESPAARREIGAKARK